MRIGYIVFTALLLTGCSISDMITYRYAFTDHRIVISGEKPEDMEISAKVEILYDDDTCRVKNQIGGNNQARWVDYIDSKAFDGGSRYQIEIPVDIENGNCEPYFAGILIYGQNKIYDMNLIALGTGNQAENTVIPLKTNDHFVATCGRTLVVRQSGSSSLFSPDCSLDLNGKQILAKYDKESPNDTNYIPILQEHLNATTEIILDVKKDQYYQSDKHNPPKVPEGVHYSNYYKSASRL